MKKLLDELIHEAEKLRDKKIQSAYDAPNDDILIHKMILRADSFDRASKLIGRFRDRIYGNEDRENSNGDDDLSY